MISRIIFAVFIVSAIGIATMLNFTTPSIGPFGVLGLFAMVYIFLVSAISLFLYASWRAIYLFRVSFLGHEIRKKHNIIYFLKFAFVLAFAPIVLIAQQSAGLGGVSDYILVAIGEIIACVYVSKR